MYKRQIINPTKKLRKGEWEVALTEIKLPPYRNFGTETIQTVIGSTKRNFTIKLEHYSDSEQLLDGIRALRIQGLTLRYNKTNGRVYYNIGSGMKLLLSPKLAEVLGFGAKQEVTGSGYSDGRADIEHGLKPILFQTGLIAPQVFRETRRPIPVSYTHLTLPTKA